MNFSLQDFLTVAAALLTLGGALLPLYQVFPRKREKEARREPQEDDPLGSVRERLRDARITLKEQNDAARANKRASTLLTSGQYIVGGILASSFVQESLSPKIVGALGVLVLFSSLIYQRFRPDIRLRGAIQRAFKIRALIRTVEDDISDIESNVAGAPTVQEIRRKISQALTDVEASEAQDLTTQIDVQGERQK